MADDDPTFELGLSEGTGGSLSEYSASDVEEIDRRYGNDNVETFISDQENANTPRKTRNDMNILENFLEVKKHESRPIETIAAKELAPLLSELQTERTTSPSSCIIIMG